MTSDLQPTHTFRARLPEGIDRLLDLGHGLELWRVTAALLREQDLNAQSQPKAMFDRLTTTIRRDGRLESLPFCAAVEIEVKRERQEPELVVQVEIVSGHHRVRAGLAAGLGFFYCLVDVTGLPRDEIRAKQLAHNAINGTSDTDLVRRIFEQINDAEARLEAFIPSSLVVEVPRVSVPDITVTLDYSKVLVMFLPIERALFERAAAAVDGHDAVYVADAERFEDFRKLAHRISSEYDIRSMGTILGTLGELVLRTLEVEPDLRDPFPLRDVLRSAFLSREDADALGRWLDRARKATKQSRLEALMSMVYGGGEVAEPSRQEEGGAVS